MKKYQIIAILAVFSILINLSVITGADFNEQQFQTILNLDDGGISGERSPSQMKEEEEYLRQYSEMLQKSHSERSNPLYDLAEDDFSEFASVVENDLAIFKNEAAKIDSIIRYLENEKNLFAKAGDNYSVMTLSERRRLMANWSSFYRSMDRLYVLALKYKRDLGDVIFHSKKDYFEGYFLGNISFSSHMLYGARFLDLTMDSDKLLILLNEEDEEEKLAAGSYDRMIRRLSDRFQAARFIYFMKFQRNFMDDYYNGEAHKVIDTDSWMQEYWNYHRPIAEATLKKLRKQTSWFSSVLLTPASKLLKKIYMPVFEKVSTWIGDTKVRRVGSSLISEHQIQEMNPCLEPGDMLFERRNWYLSNMFLGGFWPHSVLYTGTWAQAMEYYDVPEVNDYLKRITDYDTLAAYLNATYPEAVKIWKAPAHDGFPVRVMESISEGVVFNSLEESCAADFVAVTRPRLSKLDKAKALIDAMYYLGREYDFDFDFRSDKTLVCTEFVVKAYAEDSDKDGLVFTMEELPFGKYAIRSNGMAQTYAEEVNTPAQQMNFVYFLKGIEEEDKAVIAEEKDFISSHRWKAFLRAHPVKE